MLLILRTYQTKKWAKASVPAELFPCLRLICKGSWASSIHIKSPSSLSSITSSTIENYKGLRLFQTLKCTLYDYQSLRWSYRRRDLLTLAKPMICDSKTSTRNRWFIQRLKSPQSLTSKDRCPEIQVFHLSGKISFIRSTMLVTN